MNQSQAQQSLSSRKASAVKLKLTLPNNQELSLIATGLTEENRSASVPCVLNIDDQSVSFASEKISTGQVEYNNYFFANQPSGASVVFNSHQLKSSNGTDYMMGVHRQVNGGSTANNGSANNDNNGTLGECDRLLGHRITNFDDKLRSQDSPLLPPVRRALSLSSSYPDPIQICRMRRLYCPRQPPTMLRRTLSISRTNLSKKKKKKLTSYQKHVLFCLSMISFTSFLCMSIMAPFFPLEASAKGMSGTVSGLVFSCYALVVMVSSPLLGHILPKVGAKFMLISGVFAAGVTNILFGLLNRIESTEHFTIYCFLVRSCEALSAAAFTTASYTYIMYTFPDDIGTAFGLTETCVGLGMSLGPAIGSALYALGGYGFPFYVLGTLIIINVPICWYVVEPIDSLCGPDSTVKKKVDFSDVKKNGYWSLITIPEVAVVCLVVVIVSQSQGFLDPTIEPHFRQYNIPTEFVGIAFLLMSASYAILSPFIGKLAGKLSNRYPLMVAGLLISTFGLTLLGPSPFIPLDPNLWLSSASMVFMGFGYAVAFIPTFECILLLAIKKGFEDNVKTYSLVSGLWSSMYSLGEVTGPTIGGFFVDQFDFRIGATILAIASLFTALITTITSLVKCYPNCASDSPATFADDSDDEEPSEEDHHGHAHIFNPLREDVSPSSNTNLPSIAPSQSVAGTGATIDSDIGDANFLTGSSLPKSTLFNEAFPILKRAQAGSVGYISPSYGTSASAFREFGNSV